MDKKGYRFSFGPWNIHEGADPFGPSVRPAIAFDEQARRLEGVGPSTTSSCTTTMPVPDLDSLSPRRSPRKARTLANRLASQGLKAEFCRAAPLEHPDTVDGAYTSNDARCRAYALERSKKGVDIMNELGIDLMVLWLAREGTYMREAKDVPCAAGRLLEAVNSLLAYDPKIRIAIEPKPNEPMDLAYLPTMGHALALGFQSSDPGRVGVLMESAHSILAGLDPSDEIGFAMAFGKLFGVHLNDQNGLKFDQDRSFGSVDLRRAFNQVRVLDENRYWEVGVGRPGREGDPDSARSAGHQASAQ